MVGGEGGGEEWDRFDQRWWLPMVVMVAMTPPTMLMVDPGWWGQVSHTHLTSIKGLGKGGQVEKGG